MCFCLLFIAEGKPPLFNMHAMAALYHIPQNDPPMLAESHWSAEFQGFVEMCLQKDFNSRPGATRALQVCFTIIFLSLSPIGSFFC